MIDGSSVARNVAEVRARVARAGGNHVELVAVTKTFAVDAIDAVVAAGVTAIGENYAQELLGKREHIIGMGIPPSVHFIGHLQSNKVRALAEMVDVWETLDRRSVIEAVARHAQGARVCIQVNVSGEPQKSGCAPGDAATLVEFAAHSGLRVEGLMTIGVDGDHAATKRGFQVLRRLVDELGLTACSMGMSGDFELAVECGATHIRIGSALFGARVRV